MNLITITDLNRTELEPFTTLSEKQLYHYYEPDLGVFLAESPNVIERALDAGHEPLSLLVEKKMLEGQAADLIRKCGDIPIYTGEDALLSQVKGFQLTRGIQCLMRRKSLPTVEEVCTGAKRIVVLENVMNPTNVGAIFRSAAALNMDAVLLTAGCSDPLQKRALRVSVGNVFQIPWAYLPAENWMEHLKQAGFTTIAMALCDDSIAIDDPRIKAADRVAVIMGTEGDGLAHSTIAACDHTVKIPMSHNVDSLNVAAASAVAFWALSHT